MCSTQRPYRVARPPTRCPDRAGGSPSSAVPQLALLQLGQQGPSQFLRPGHAVVRGKPAIEAAVDHVDLVGPVADEQFDINLVRPALDPLARPLREPARLAVVTFALAGQLLFAGALVRGVL